MRQTVILAATLFTLARSHGDHAEVVENPDATYAELHMASEHHMDSFDMPSFFHLHDLNNDGILDQNELESVYGVHHEKLKKASGSVEVHTEQAKEIVKQVLAKLDTNQDGVLTMREFLAGDVGGLPNFKGVEHLGHHYDAEGEYFLHHEEKYHNTPETQNEEDYVHPEDIEHFMAHEEIEAEEEERVREFQGLPTSTEEDDANAVAAARAALAASGEPGSQQVFLEGEGLAGEGLVKEPLSSPQVGQVSPEEQARIDRATFAREQALKFSKAAKEASKRGEWGADGAFKRPRDASDRLRKSVPYKYKTRKSWFGEF